MQAWEVTANTFIAPWRSRSEVTGALVCGSYVSGNPTPRSDIDVHIILREGAGWRQRGSQVVGGYMVEYFANPPSTLREEFRDDHHANCWMAMVPFVAGRVLFDASGDIARLRAEAREWIAKPFQLPRDPAMVPTMKYGLWDTWDNVRDAYESNSPDFPLVYHNCLSAVYRIYSRYLGWHLCPTHQIYRLLTDPSYRARYGIPAFPDAEFVQLFRESVQACEREQMLRAMDAVRDHVVQAMGGFEVDGWSIRTELR